MNKVLITGSLGLVGSACMEFFNEKGYEVLGIDNNGRSQFFGTPEKLYGDGSTYNYDIRSKAHLNQLFAKFQPDIIIHAAAQPSHDYATDHVLEDFEVNTIGTLNLLECAREYCPNVTFIFVSTDKVYGENMAANNGWDQYGPIPLDELPTRYSRTSPYNELLGLDFAGHRSLFGCSKTAADVYVQEYGNTFGMKTACFRPGCITGKNHEGAEQHGFIAYLAKSIKEGKTYKVFGFKGKQVRDQIHALDLASAFWHFAQNPKVAAVYNIGGGMDRSVSVLEAGDLISKEVGKPFNYELHEARKGDRQWDVHDVSKFRADYPDWDYTYSLQDIIKDVCNK